MQMLLKVVAFVALALGLRAVEAQSTGRTLVLGGIPYFVPPTPVSALRDVIALSIAAKSASDGLDPFSVIPTSKTPFDGTALQQTVDEWSARDDVWSKEFLTGT